MSKLTKVTKRKECGSTDLYWFPSMRNQGQAQDGRICLREVTCDFVLGCAECSETLAVVRGDTVATHLTEQLNGGRS